MKFTLALFLMFGFTLQAQKRDVPAVICMNNGDTLKTNIEVLVNLFDDKMIKDISFASKVKLSKASNNISKIEPKEIKLLTITDFYNTNRIFKYDGKKQLHEVIYEGVIKVYVSFNASSNGHGKSIDFYDETGQRIKVGPFSTSTKALKKAVKEIPYLVEIIDNSKLNFYETVVQVLTIYEKEYINKLN